MGLPWEASGLPSENAAPRTGSRDAWWKKDQAWEKGLTQNRMWVSHTRSSVQFSCSVVSDSVTAWTAARQASLSVTKSQSLPKPMSIELVMPFNHLILCRPLLLPPAIFPSIRVFPNESALRIRWPKYWSFSFNISPSSEHPGLISFRIACYIPLRSKELSRVFSQHHSSKALLLHSAFFIVQLSHPYMTTGKTTALTRCTFVCKLMSLLFNMLSKVNAKITVPTGVCLTQHT